MTIIITIIFILGYLAIAFEHPLKINKAASALLTGVICWSVYALTGSDRELVSENLAHHLGDIAGILFFLLGAMVIVELIDAHDGFEVITERIQTTNKRKLVWIVGLITFFLSAALDNLTTTIVMVSLLRKLIPSHKERLLFAGLVVIAANAGGAWSPIGDVTTTMLWVGNQITSSSIMASLIVPSLVCLIIPVAFMAWRMKGNFERPDEIIGLEKKLPANPSDKYVVFVTGVLVLFFVPVFKAMTGLPPFMGILLGVGVLWLVTEIIHKKKNDEHRSALSVSGA